MKTTVIQVLKDDCIQFKARPLFYQGFPGSSVGKESACSAGDLGLIPELGRSPGEGNGYPLQYSGLENFMGCIVYVTAKSLTRLSDFHFVFSSTKKDGD